MGDVLGFKTAFQEAASKFSGVKQVEYFGSLEATTFRQGKSDADIIIYGKVAPEDKIKIWAMLKQLNEKYRLGLETAPFLHPSPFYIDTRAKQFLFRTLFNGHAIIVFTPYREFGKAIFPTYGQIWRGERTLDNILGGLSESAKKVFFSFM